MLPGEKFALLWAQVEPHAHQVVLDPWAGRNAIEFKTLTDIIRNCPHSSIPVEIEAYLKGESVSFSTDSLDDSQRAFIVMCALDDAAMDIHPSTKTHIIGRTITLSRLQEEMKSVRTANFRYAYLPEVGSVIAKGQLTGRRVLNEAENANGANLESQFEYLTVVADPKPYTASFLVIAPYKFGMDEALTHKLGIAPIAEDANDLTFTATSRLGRGYLDARPTDPAALSTRLTEAVTSLLDQGAGIVALPELVCSSNAIKALQAKLRCREKNNGDAILVCGSGLSSDPCPSSGRHFNEATVMTGGGNVLFSQRKIHPFNMAANRMKECGVAHDPLHEGKPHMEDIAASATLTICDLPDVGRIMVMICEDFEQGKPTGQLALAARPDWIFAPVLDVSLELGRWMHQRCMEIGRHSLSRIVITSSTTLSVRRKGKTALAEMNADEVGFGILYDGYQGRRVKQILSSSTCVSPQTVKVEWDSATWPHDVVGARE